MDIQQIKALIRQELPAILQEDAEMQRFVASLSRHFADRAEVESRFDRLLDELHRDREEQGRKWAENQAAINQMLQSIQALARKHDSTIGALGARWGLHAEASFRNALKGILEDLFGVQVLNVVEYDDAGEVFGHPDQVELDVIIKDGLLVLAEISSSMSRADMYAFERKARFYEKKHGRKVSRLLVISPMVERRAQAVADKLGVQVYSYAEDVDPATFA